VRKSAAGNERILWDELEKLIESFARGLGTSVASCAAVCVGGKVREIGLRA